MLEENCCWRGVWSFMGGGGSNFKKEGLDKNRISLKVTSSKNYNFWKYSGGKLMIWSRDTQFATF